MPRNGEARDNGGPAPKRVHPAFIHAFEKVGFLLTEQNAHTFSAEDVQAWDDAVAEGEGIYGPVDPED